MARELSPDSSFQVCVTEGQYHPSHNKEDNMIEIPLHVYGHDFHFFVQIQGTDRNMMLTCKLKSAIFEGLLEIIYFGPVENRGKEMEQKLNRRWRI